MDAEPNLYEAPTARLGEPYGEPHAWHGFRPRVIPAGIAYFFGFYCFCLVLVSAASLGLAVYRYWDVPFRFDWLPVAGLVFFLVLGVLGIVAGRAWMRGLWRRAITSTAIFLGLCGAVAVMWPFL